MHIWGNGWGWLIDFIAIANVEIMLPDLGVHNAKSQHTRLYCMALLHEVTPCDAQLSNLVCIFKVEMIVWFRRKFNLMNFTNIRTVWWRTEMNFPPGNRTEQTNQTTRGTFFNPSASLRVWSYVGLAGIQCTSYTSDISLQAKKELHLWIYRWSMSTEVC